MKHVNPLMSGALTFISTNQSIKQTMNQNIFIWRHTSQAHQRHIGGDWAECSRSL